MAAPDPIVRQLVLCERAVFVSDGNYTLYTPRVDFQTEAGEVFPVEYPELWLFAQFTDSYGLH
jgi:hypothetical protein